MSQIHASTLRFLADLSSHNDRQWFADHKASYVAAQANAKAFLADLVARMSEADDIEHSRLYRIYRDVRFSKDKSPYNPRFGMSLSRRKPYLRGGYFISIRSEETTVTAGFWGPNAGDLALIRSHIDSEGDQLREAVESAQIQAVYGELKGEALKTAPRGFKQDHPHIELLRKKQFLFSRTFNPAETTAPDFLEEVVFTLLAVRPFFDHMGDVLSHDPNGQPLY